jgi:diaminopimelate epimerase
VIFHKYEGLGNDFIVLEDFDCTAPKDPAFAIRWCDRRFGIGADGILYIGKATAADASMKVLNSDGSEAEMCGNGIRCVAKHLYDYGFVKRRKMLIDTLAGKKSIECHVKDGKVTDVRVNMGTPMLECEQIPMRCQGRFIDQTIVVEGTEVKGTAVSMGNPHFVIFQRIGEAERKRLGPLLERSAMFPKRTNVEFASVKQGHIEVEVFERGAGWTKACGTGACATTVAAVLNHHVPSDVEVEVRLPGGSLWINVTEDLSAVSMRGPATRVFRGELEA